MTNELMVQDLIALKDRLFLKHIQICILKCVFYCILTIKLLIVQVIVKSPIDMFDNGRSFNLLTQYNLRYCFLSSVCLQNSYKFWVILHRLRTNDLIIITQSILAKNFNIRIALPNMYSHFLNSFFSLIIRNKVDFTYCQSTLVHNKLRKLIKYIIIDL